MSAAELSSAGENVPDDIDIHTTAGKLADFERRVQEATHAGSERAVEKQHARGKKTDVNGVPYVRGGWLKRIDYGQRHNAVYTSHAPARVRFDVKERCLPAGSADCDPEDLTTATASRWPDVPFDRNCTANVKCKADQIMPTFWTRARLNAIVTEIRGASSWSPVDQWTLEHLFTDNGDGSATIAGTPEEGPAESPVTLTAVNVVSDVALTTTVRVVVRPDVTGGPVTVARPTGPRRAP